MDRTYCASRNHITVDRSAELPARTEPLSVYSVLRSCRFGLAVWVLAAIVLGLLVGWPAGAFIAALFVVTCSVVLLFRKAKGHTFKCSLLGALSGTLRATDFVSW